MGDRREGHAATAAADPGAGRAPGQLRGHAAGNQRHMYLSTPYNRVVALDANTAREFWQHPWATAPTPTRCATGPAPPASS